MINAISRKVSLFIIIAIFLLITQVTVSFASGDFKATYAETIEVCSCSSVQNNFKILNKDTVSYITTSYFISTSGEAAEFFSLAYPEFKLKRGESITNFGYITAPCSAKGNYDLFIDIHTSSGISQRIKQTISIKRCDNLGLYTQDNDETIDPCETADYSFIIKNTGDFTEKYIIGVDQLAQYVSLSANPVTIKAGESRQIYMYIKPECNMIDDKEIKVTVISSKNRLSAELPFFLRINPDYYNYDMSLYDTRYTICADSRTVIPVTIKNYAGKDSEIWLELDGEEFAELEENEIIIAGDSEKSVDILLNSPDARDEEYDFTIYAKSKTTGIIKSISFKVDVESCYGFALEHKNFRANHSKQTIPVNLRSTAEKTARYTLKLDGPSWLSLETQEINLEPGEVKQALIISEPSDSVKGKYYAIIKAYPDTDNSIFYKEEFTITISDKVGFMAAVAAMFSNIYFLFATIDIVLIILAVLLFKHLTKTKDRDTKQKTLTEIAKPEEVPSSTTKDVKIVKSAKMSDKKEKQLKAEEKTEKTPYKYKSLLLLLGGILIVILIIIFSLYAYGNFIGESTSGIGNIVWQGIVAAAALLFAYKWYIICIILLVIAVILLITTGIGKSMAVWKNKYLSQAIIIIIAVLVVLSLLTAGFYFYRDNGFSKDWTAGINDSLDNESQVKEMDILNNVSQDYGTEGLPEDEVIEGDIEGGIIVEEKEKEEITEEEVKALEGPILEWEMNNNMTLDLTKMFHDPDGDMLNFSANSTEHIDISIDMLTGIATLIPEQNWVGISELSFSANDGKGGIATSGKINLVVWEKDPRGARDKIKSVIPSGIRTSVSVIRDYGYYIIAGFIILLIFIIITRNNKDLISFPEEELPPEEGEDEEKKEKDSKKPRKKGKKKAKKKN